MPSNFGVCLYLLSLTLLRKFKRYPLYVFFWWTRSITNSYHAMLFYKLFESQPKFEMPFRHKVNWKFCVWITTCSYYLKTTSKHHFHVIIGIVSKHYTHCWFVLRFVLLWFRSRPTYFSAASLRLGQSYTCPSHSKATLIILTGTP